MFELKEYNETALPDVMDVLDHAQEFISVDNQWTHRKVCERAHIFTKWHNNDFWAMRVSNHINLTYEDMLATIFHNHTENEKEYIEMVENYKLLDPSKDASWQSKIVTYKLPFPFARRDMAFWMIKEETLVGRQFVIVSMPRNVSVDNCKGMYVSIEEVTKLENGGVQWTMATTSQAGGFIPDFLQRYALPSAIAADIPQYERWVNKKKRQNNNIL